MASMSSEFPRPDKSDNHQAELNVNSSWNSGNVNGKMKLIELRGKQFSRLRRQSIEVTIYRTRAEHFAAIHPKTKDSPAVGILKLKNTVAESLDNGSFQVREMDCDNPTALTFLLEQPEDLDYWLMAFNSNSSGPSAYKSDLSNIPETDEDESEED